MGFAASALEPHYFRSFNMPRKDDSDRRLDLEKDVDWCSIFMKAWRYKREAESCDKGNILLDSTVLCEARLRESGD